VSEDGACRFFVPLVIRPIDGAPAISSTLYDASSPYGYPAPLLKGARRESERREFLASAIRMLQLGLRERRVVSAFVRLHPLLPLPPEPFRQHGTLVHHGETVYMDLTQPEEELWDQIRRNHQRRITSAREKGYVAEIDEWAYFDDFYEIYTDTMTRVKASEFYFFSRDYFHELKEALQGGLHLGVARINGSVACAAIFGEVCGIIQGHLAGARSEYNRDSPTVFLNDFIRCWAKKRGNRWYHLGGGRGAGNDALLRFKAGFSKLRSDFYTWRSVLDVEAYEALVRQWERRAGTGADGPSGYFPAYRRELPGPDVPRRTAQAESVRTVSSEAS